MAQNEIILIYYPINEIFLKIPSKFHTFRLKGKIKYDDIVIESSIWDVKTLYIIRFSWPFDLYQFWDIK